MASVVENRLEIISTSEPGEAVRVGGYWQECAAQVSPDR